MTESASSTRRNVFAGNPTMETSEIPKVSVARLDLMVPPCEACGHREDQIDSLVLDRVDFTHLREALEPLETIIFEHNTSIVDRIQGVTVAFPRSEARELINIIDAAINIMAGDPIGFSEIYHPRRRQGHDYAELLTNLVMFNRTFNKRNTSYIELYWAVSLA